MHIVLQTSERTLVSFSAEELAAITSSLNAICNGVAIPDSEFQARLGYGREVLESVLSALIGEVHSSSLSYEAADAWADQSSVMVRCITAFGDPVEMGEAQAVEFAERLQRAIAEVS